jgi:hypothetical protein
MPIACHAKQADKELFLKRLLLCLLSIPMSVKIAMNLSNGHLPQIRETPSLLVLMCRGESLFFKNGLWRMSASLRSPSKPGLQMYANLASPTHFQKWQTSGEFSNSINSLSSGHCLHEPQLC